MSSAYLFTHIYECRDLVDGLYLFTIYALPLTMLLIAFGSDYLANCYWFRLPA